MQNPTIPLPLLNRFRRALLRALPHLHEGLREEAAAFLVTGQLDMTTNLRWTEGDHRAAHDSSAAYLLRFGRVIRVSDSFPEMLISNFKGWLQQLEDTIPSTDEES